MFPSGCRIDQVVDELSGQEGHFLPPVELFVLRNHPFRPQQSALP